ncbi:hypothetical protein GX586_13645 [bacterium]|nr:hypothetical protein [bacterium]
MTIGIPRALFYHYHPGMWEALFDALGHEPVLSGVTTDATVEAGGRLAESEACLSCKVFAGHCAQLAGKGVDALFIPRYFSVIRNAICCPKLYALAETTAAELPCAPRIIRPRVDANREPLTVTLCRVAAMFTKNPSRIWRAVARARAALAPPGCAPHPRAPGAGVRVLLLGHAYNLGDQRVNHHITRMLEALGCAVVPSVSVVMRAAHRGRRWHFLDEALWCAGEAAVEGWHGVVHLSAFNCGCDAVVKSMLERQCRARGLPYLPLVVDEHTESGAVQTRVEAFVDSLGDGGEAAWNGGAVTNMAEAV